MNFTDRTRTLLTPKWTPFIPHQPTPKQHAALLLDDYRELLYGGAAGGGKSDYLLMAALQYVDVPGYSAVIFRRTYPQLALADGLLARAQEWLAGKAHGTDTVSGTPTRYIFPSKARLDFAHCQHEKDRFNYHGAAWQFLGFDELTQFSLTIYLYLTSRVRRPEGFPVPLRKRSGSNPGGIGHDWVKARLVVGGTGGDGLRRRVFVPAMLADNPYLDREEYARSLSEMHPYDRDQLLHGNWDARPPGGRFKREWFEFIDEAPADMEWVRRWDLAATEAKKGRDPDWTVGGKMGRRVNGKAKFVIDDVRRVQKSPADLDALITQTANQDGLRVKARMEQEPGASGKIAIAHFAALLQAYDFKGVPSTGSKSTRANPFAAACERGEVALVRGPWNEPFLRELEMFTEDDSEYAFDDQVDFASGAYTDLTYKRGVTPADSNLFRAPVEAEAMQ